MKNKTSFTKSIKIGFYDKNEQTQLLRSGWIFRVQNLVQAKKLSWIGLGLRKFVFFTVNPKLNLFFLFQTWIGPELELPLFMMKELFFFSIYFTNTYFLLLHKFGEIWLTDMYLTKIEKTKLKGLSVL